MEPEYYIKKGLNYFYVFNQKASLADTGISTLTGILYIGGRITRRITLTVLYQEWLNNNHLVSTLTKLKIRSSRVLKQAMFKNTEP